MVKIVGKYISSKTIELAKQFVFRENMRSASQVSQKSTYV